MAKRAAGTHQPLRWHDKLRLNAAKKHLHSKFHSVRQAALKEIQAILARKRGLQNRLSDWLRSARNAAVRKVTPHRLHKPLRVQKQAPQAPRRGQATPIRARMPKNGFTPLTGHPLTRAELRERTRAAKQARRSGQPAPQRARQNGQRAPRQPDAMQQATETMRRAHQQAASQPGPVRRAGAKRAASGHERHAEAAGRKATASPAAPPYPDAAVSRERTGDGPGRTRPGRSRTRTTA